jgi:hypothetical protein
MARKTRKQLRARARYLRQKIAKGQELTEAETGELERWEASKADPVSAEDAADDAADDGAAQDSDAGDGPADSIPALDPDAGEGVPPSPAPGPSPDPAPEASPTQAAPAPPPPPRVKAGPLPKPPRIDPEDAAPKGGKRDADWKEKHREAARGSGREATCEFIAGQWISVLKAMSDDIKAAGISPLVDVESAELRAVIVLTVDEFLPARVQVKTSHMAAFGTTALVGQRFWHRKAIAEATGKAKERTEHAKRREAAQAERAARETTEATEAAQATQAIEVIDHSAAQDAPPPPAPTFDPDAVI